MHEEDCFSVKWGERGCGQAEGLRNSYIVVSRDAIGEEGSVVSQDSREVVGGNLIEICCSSSFCCEFQLMVSVPHVSEGDIARFYGHGAASLTRRHGLPKQCEIEVVEIRP